MRSGKKEKEKGNERGAASEESLSDVKHLARMAARSKLELVKHYDKETVRFGGARQHFKFSIRTPLRIPETKGHDANRRAWRC